MRCDRTIIRLSLNMKESERAVPPSVTRHLVPPSVTRHLYPAVFILDGNAFAALAQTLLVLQSHWYAFNNTGFTSDWTKQHLGDPQNADHRQTRQTCDHEFRARGAT